MRRDPAIWHPRYLRQAAWTESIRRRAWAVAGAGEARRILEVGSGTGVVLSDLSRSTAAVRVGLDLDLPGLRFQHGHDPDARLCAGDGARMPFSDGAFDVALCHYLLLWVARPDDVVGEMARIIRAGGWLLCLAEPDYGGRIDFPGSLLAIGEQQRQALRQQGADPDLGRRLRALLTEAGLASVQAGVLGAEWVGPTDPDELAAEWRVLRSDLRGRVSEADLARAEQEDRAASESGRRVLYVPTFYAFGRKPHPPTH